MFRTALDPAPSKKKINYQSEILTIGSCFADSIGKRLEENKFHVLPNPFGVIYNPLAIFKLLEYSINKSYPQPSTYLSSQNISYNYDFHSDFSALSQDELKLKVEGAVKSTHKSLKRSNFVIFTFGTSVGYFLKENDELVANCHKIPAVNFRKSLITQKLILTKFASFRDQLKNFNPDINIILTVSPVRHLRETIELNSVSKSVLRLSCHTLQELYNDVCYFPAYEILLDDLRDYRFYSRDMIHPNEQAEDYIWEKFVTCFMDGDTREILHNWEKIKKSIDHKPFHQESDAHQKFLLKTLGQLNDLDPQLNVSRELDRIKRQLRK